MSFYILKLNPDGTLDKKRWRSSLMQTRLQKPNTRIESDMWVDEAIWGHRLYDEQTLSGYVLWNS